MTEAERASQQKPRMKHSVLLTHPRGLCLCGSRTLSWHSSPAQGLTHFWKVQAPYLASSTGERLQVLARGQGAMGGDRSTASRREESI